MSSPHDDAPQNALRVSTKTPGHGRRILTGPATATFRAWSCTMRLVVADERVLAPARRDLTHLLARVDRAANRFRADSALTIANERAGRPTPVPQLLADLVSAALRAAERTDGAVSPTVGRALADLGYDRDFREISGGSLAARQPVADWRRVALDRRVGLLTVPVGSALDLGATAKACTADLAARSLARRYDTAVLVELGGDLAVAGDRPDGWGVRVAEHEGGPGQVVRLRRGGLTTSTTTVRRWAIGNSYAHHIVDPRTGRPATGPWRTVSVSAPSAYDANVASTAAIVLGEDAVGWLERHRIAARLVHRDGSLHLTPGWPADRNLAGAA